MQAYVTSHSTPAERTNVLLNTLICMYNDNHHTIQAMQQRNLEIQRHVSRLLTGGGTNDTVFVSTTTTNDAAHNTQWAQVIEQALQQTFSQQHQPQSPGLTPAQLEHHTRRVFFRDIVHPHTDQCPITQRTFSDNDEVLVTRPCNHVFDPPSLVQWLQAHNTCPVCRTSFQGTV